jgi:DNA-binding transcriptional regulator YhcF (GntR family)
MSKKIFINESTMKKIVAYQILEEAGLSKTDVESIVKDAIKNDRQLNKDIEKKVKNIVADCVNMLFKTLWQRRNFYEDEIKKG